MVTANQKSKIDIHTKKKKEYKHNTKDSHQITRNENKRMKRNEDILRDLWDNIKCTNVHILGVPEGEEREKGPEKIFEEIIVENFPNMGKKS